jgi:hypothetical protein
MLKAAAARARERDVTVALATGTPPEARLAFAALHQLLLPFLDAPDRLPLPGAVRMHTARKYKKREAPISKVPQSPTSHMNQFLSPLRGKSRIS